MKTISSTLKTHLAGGLTTVCTCWALTRTDGVQFFFTDHDQDVVVSSVTYKAALSYQRTAIQGKSDYSLDSLELRGILAAGDVTDADLRAGKYDGAFIQIFLVNYNNAAGGDVLALRAGYIGKVTLGEFGYTAELMGLTEALQRRVGDVYQPTCRAVLGDTKCTIDLAALGVSDIVASVSDQSHFDASTLTQPGPVVKTYTSNTFSFAINRFINDSASGFLSHGFANNDVIDIVGSAKNDDPHTIRAITADHIACDPGTSQIMNEQAGNSITISSTTLGYFDLGYLTWTSGANAGTSMEVQAWAGPSTKLITLFLPMPNIIAPGDGFTIYPGCDKRIQTCLNKFSNVLNFRGEPFVPGQDAVMAYPNAV